MPEEATRAIDSDPSGRGGTWGSSDAVAEWQRGLTARGRFFGLATERMLDQANIGAGSRVLDVGAGSGESTLAAARRVGRAGLVLATDISANMLEAAATSAKREGLSNVETRVMDAQKLDLVADSFDAVISRFALMLIPDIERALIEIRRVLRSGGTAAVLVFSTPEKEPFLSIPHTIARRVGRLPSPPEPFGEFRLGNPGVLSAAFSKAGFHGIAVHAVTTRRRFSSAAAAVQYAKETPLPLRKLLGQLTLVLREQAWAQIEREFQRFVGPDGFDSPSEVLIGTGIK